MSIQKTTTELETLKINYLTQEMYEDALGNDEINTNELYMVPDEGSSTQIWYGTCDSASTTAEKIVVCEGFKMHKGDIIIILFTNNNSSGFTLNINNTGTMSVFHYTRLSTYDIPITWAPGAVLTFVYEGLYSESIPNSHYCTLLSNMKTVNNQSLFGEGNVQSVTSLSRSLSVANWSNNSQTISVSGITSSSIIFTSPAPASYDEYVINHVRCTGQGDGTLTFSCDFVPDAAITINIIIF